MGEGQAYDVVIIGGGPAGATAAIYAARAGLRTVVVDKGLRTGSLGMATKIENFPGVPDGISGADLLARMRSQAEGFGAQFIQDRVLSADLTENPKSVWGTKGFYQGRAVVIATGSTGRAQVVPGERELVGRGVSYCATCDGAFFRDQVVAVAGNNQEAVEEALLLARFARQVYLLVQTPELRVTSELAEQARDQPKLVIYPATRLQEVIGQHRVEGVRLVGREGEERVLPVDGLFVYLQGARPATDFVGDQLATTESGCLEADEVMQTALPGVFAVGDVLCTHMNQAVIAAGEGALAAVSVERHLAGREKLRPDWS